MIDALKDYARYGWQLVSGWRIEHERWIADLRRADLPPFQNGSNSLSVLDLANGQLRPQYRILRSQGHRVYGIDVINRPTPSWKHYAYRAARQLYARNIQAKLSLMDDTLICGDVSTLPFRDLTFDVVTSVAAFEHFLDVPRVVKEIHRVVRPGGFAWILVHLFTSLSGGHNVSLSQVPLRTLPRGVDAWDHLRQRRLPFHVPLNQWRAGQYLSEFSKYFDIFKHYCAMCEGEHLLTRQIQSELTNYSRDELTCAAYVLVAKKPS